MSRRSKNVSERLILPGVGKLEWKLKNYLHINDIYKGNNDMQTIIINSFYNQYGGNNNDDWKDKLFIVNDNFGLFAQYAQNQWKHNLPVTDPVPDENIEIDNFESPMPDEYFGG